MDDVLRTLQLTQLEILKVFDAFCREHDLKYSLYAGSLLGAVRHQGFIPWDDDLDVCMDRGDYDRFPELWQQNPVEGYVLQNKENSKYFDQSFTKLRKDHTTFLQDEWEIGNHHTGIFLDVFPIDRIPNGKRNRAVFKARCILPAADPGVCAAEGKCPCPLRLIGDSEMHPGSEAAPAAQKAAEKHYKIQ